MGSDTRFLHTVFFWLRESSDAAAAEKLADGARRHLSGIPGVRRIAIGFPAGTQRSVVDNSFGVSLHLEFANATDHDVYQGHPDHHRFIEECSLLWERVVVYDSIVKKQSP